MSTEAELMLLQDKIEHILQDKEKLKNRIMASAKDKFAASLGWMVVIAVVVIGLIGYFIQSFKPEEARVQGISISSSTPSATPNTEIAALKVDVSGAVNQPGVKELRNGDRVEDALRAAGGIAASADSEYIAMNINLAAKLQDGDKIFIPVKGQSIQSSTSSTSPPASKTSISSSTSSAAGGKVSINRASASELDGLPGIGATYAARIIGGRPYKSVDDLCSRSDIFRSKSICDKIRPLVSL
jgi:competence protein ComEA